jgi:hypothetical protein
MRKLKDSTDCSTGATLIAKLFSFVCVRTPHTGHFISMKVHRSKHDRSPVVQRKADAVGSDAVCEPVLTAPQLIRLIQFVAVVRPAL